jgi:hypothetical protein
VWAALDAWPLNPGWLSFLVVRGAERLQNPVRLADWLTDKQAPKRLSVFVSDEEKWPIDRNPEVRSRVLSSKSMYVECGLASEKTSVEAAMSWLQTRDELFARRVLDLNGWRLEATRDVARKASVLGALGSLKVLSYLSEPNPGQQFVDELTACNRSKALQSAILMENHEKSPAIGLLDHNLDVLSRINGQLKRSRSQREIASRLGLHRVMVEKLYPYAKMYDNETVMRRAVELAKADRALVSGARIGVMERLAALW